MAHTNRLPPLEHLARTQAAKLAATVLHNMILKEKQDKMNSKQLNKKCKRKRSNSCGNDGQKELRMNKKCRLVGHDLQCAAQLTAAKRPLENIDVEDTNIIKRQRTGETSSQSHIFTPSCEKPLCPYQKTTDDITISYGATNTDTLKILRQYFVRLSPLMWNEFGKFVVTEIITRTRIEHLDQMYLEKAVEFICCEKLSSFSTMVIERISSHLERIFFKKLKQCTRLVTLELSLLPTTEANVIDTTVAIQRLKYLKFLALLPPSRYSFHWTVEPVAQHCFKLEELRIIYNGDLFNDDQGLSSLRNCKKLVALWLFNFGRNSETKCLSGLLRSLPNLKVLFHKELPNAILELHESWATVQDTGGNGSDGRDEWHRLKNHRNSYGQQLAWEDSQPLPDRMFSCQLKLERLDLCWYQQGVGYQLVYVPSSYLLRVAQICPQIRYLNLVGPPCIAQVIKNLPCLQTIILQQVSLTACLMCTLQDTNLDRITEIRVTDVWDVTYNFFSAVANQCQNLQVFSVISSNLEAQGELKVPSQRSAAFPSLREITLVPTMQQEGRPSLTTPSVWQLGAALTTFLLEGTSSQLVSLHLQYKEDNITLGDVPREQDLANVLCQSPRPVLHSLRLDSPPEITCNLVEAIVAASPGLTTLGGITTWPLTMNQRAMIIAQYGMRLDIS